MENKLEMTLIDRYLRYQEATEKSKATIATARNSLRQTLTALQNDHGVVVGKDSVSGIDGGILYDWYAAISNRGCSMATKNLHVIMLNQFLRWLYTLNSPSTGKTVIDQDWSGILKCGKVKKEKDLPPEMQVKRTYEKEEIVNIINSQAGYNRKRDQAIVSLASGTGMRCSELCSLNMDQWERIQTEKSVLVKRKGGNWAVIEVPDYVLPYLKSYVEQRKMKEGYAGMDESGKIAFDSSPLFVSTHGNRMNQNSMYKAIRHKQENLGMKTGLHNFRHTVLSNMPSASLARDVAGHSSFAVTTIYTHTDRQQRSEAVNNLPWADGLK